MTGGPTDKMTAFGCKERLRNLRCCVVMPTYNNAGTLRDVISEVLGYCADVIVVNDGSTDATAQIISSFDTCIRSLSMESNRGKGIVLQCGMAYAVRLGYKYAITIDSDGQHYPSDLPIFAEAIENEYGTLLVGARNLRAEGMPGKNTFANRFSNFWFRLETGIRLEDTQSGYRYYPPEGERVSHFRPLRDFTRISILNMMLVLYCLLWRWPVNFCKKLTWTNIKSFIDRNILHSPESNARIAAAIFLGVLMGVMPIWGYQMVCAFALAHLLKLNKVITLVAANISLPPLIPFIIFGGYWTGCKILGQPVIISLNQISVSSIGGILLQYLVGSIVFGIALAALCWAVSLLLLKIFRHPKSDNNA